MVINEMSQEGASPKKQGTPKVDLLEKSLLSSHDDLDTKPSSNLNLIDT